MCGEIDEQILIGQEMLDRFKHLARGMELPDAQSNLAAPANLADEQGRADYMETVFRTGLSGALDAISRAEEDEKIDALAGQAIALARLAGFLAGQLPAEADLFRALIDAVSQGHADARERALAHDHRHDHHHHHDHDHHHH